MYTYENARRKPAEKQLSERQYHAHAKSRAAFARARQIWSAVPGCDPYAALRQAWGEVNAGKIPPDYTKRVKPKKPKKNPYHVTPGGTAFYLPQGEISSPRTRGAQQARLHLKAEGIEQPLYGYTIRKSGNQYKIIDPDGNDTGKYGLSEEAAERLLAKHAR